ncbi:hypothetical protein NOR_06633 [Metarhizium rileyi]|uniref:Uncharacterized protein n=1 Tax=Metarhizium rileyi (strain RCEF 4871) TaxID=1649241 RepID=A0A167A6Q0_METRR|nr:hypothetical protein NOR_06633 [Metarhizium rileyi RCEF 4871]
MKVTHDDVPVARGPPTDCRITVLESDDEDDCWDAAQRAVTDGCTEREVRRDKEMDGCGSLLRIRHGKQQRADTLRDEIAQTGLLLSLWYTSERLCDMEDFEWFPGVIQFTALYAKTLALLAFLGLRRDGNIPARHPLKRWSSSNNTDAHLEPFLLIWPAFQVHRKSRRSGPDAGEDGNSETD